MKSLAELANYLRTNRIYLPLPWQGYDGPFCCRSCVAAELLKPAYQGYLGFIFISEQSIEDTWNGSISIYFSYYPTSLEHGAEKAFADLLYELLAAVTSVEWNGNLSQGMCVTVRSDSETNHWILNQTVH